MTESTNYLNSSEAIAALGVSDRTLRRYASTGRINSRKVGKQVYYDLNSYVQQEIEATDSSELVTASFVGICFDQRYETISRGQPVGKLTPITTFMLPAKRVVQPDGTAIVDFPMVPIAIGANLDFRVGIGLGLISGQDWNAISTLPLAQKWLDLGVLKVFIPQHEQFGGSYRSYSEADALELVATTYNLFDLERYSQSEDRKIVLQAISEQRKEIETQIEFSRSNVVSSTDRNRVFRQGVAAS